MMRTRLAAALFSFLIVSAWGARSSLRASPWGEKPLGVLLVGRGPGADWDRFVADLRKSFGRELPLETFTGPVATKGLQRALDRLQAAKVKKIVVVPLVLEPQSDEVEQLRYILGMRELPSEPYLEAWKMKSRVVPRVKAKVPLVLSSALDDPAVAAEILLERAGKMSRSPADEAVFLIGRGAADDAAHALRAAQIEAVAKRMAETGPYKPVRTALLRPDTRAKPRQEDDSERALRGAIRSLSRDKRVIALPFLLQDDGSARDWRKRLDNLFLRWRGEAMLPDGRLVRWVQARVAESRAKEDMVKFKDAGRALPPAPPRGAGKVGGAKRL